MGRLEDYWETRALRAEQELKNIKPYVQHLDDCDMSGLHYTSLNYHCTCGLTDTLENKDVLYNTG